MIFNIHGGHNRIVPGASGYFSEVEEDRKVKDLVITKLRQLGHTVYDCTDDAGTSQNQNLANIVAKCNAHKVDIDLSIHFNASGGAGYGVEAYTYDNLGSAYKTATALVNAISELGFRNRGAKVNKDYYVVRKTVAPAILLECCFCDNAQDAAKYNAESMANAIVKGLTGQTAGTTVTQPANNSAASGGFLVRVKGGLNIRTGAGVANGVVGCITDKGTYTIVATAQAPDGGTWGKLKSGAGWINIGAKFVTRV
jgi:hypothetical protein